MAGFKQNSMRKPSITEILNILNKAPEIMKQYNITSDAEGAKKAMEMAGMSISDLSRYRDMVNSPLVRNIAEGVAKKLGVNLDDFIKFVDNFIATNGNKGVGNRQQRRMESKILGEKSNTTRRSSWRDS